MPTKINTVVVIDTAKLLERLNKTALQEPLVYRLIEVLRSGGGFDATEVICQAVEIQSAANKDLLGRCVKLAMMQPPPIIVEGKSHAH